MIVAPIDQLSSTHFVNYVCHCSLILFEHTQQRTLLSNAIQYDHRVKKYCIPRSSEQCVKNYVSDFSCQLDRCVAFRTILSYPPSLLNHRSSVPFVNRSNTRILPTACLSSHRPSCLFAPLFGGGYFSFCLCRELCFSMIYIIHVVPYQTCTCMEKLIYVSCMYIYHYHCYQIVLVHIFGSVDSTPAPRVYMVVGVAPFSPPT